MIIQIDKLFFNINYEETEIQNKIPIVFLHGFTGNLNDWKFVKNKIPKQFSPIFIDLVGHGKSASPSQLKYYSSKSQVSFLNKILNTLKIKKVVIVGYSMGGRLALDFTFKFPEKVNLLILESTSFGLKSKKEKDERIINDEKIADKIAESSFEQFIEYWLSIPLFSSLKNLPKEKIEKIKKEKIKSNNSLGLKNSLIGFSTGKMKNYFSHENKLEHKVILITGELDEKFTSISKDALKILKNGNHKIVKKAGHNVHLEKPEEFLKLLNEFLLNI